MSETLGSIVDRLITVDMKMWNNQEFLYEIRKMSFEEFQQKMEDAELVRDLWDILKKACDLNVQRNVLIDDLDTKLIEIIESDDREKYIQRKHKTY
jgi:hypothetical protein